MDSCSEPERDLPPNEFLAEPLEVFRESLDDLFDPDESGTKKGALFTDVLSEEDAAKVPKEEPRRSEVFALAGDDSVHVAAVCTAAMAWGGMHLGHWKLLWDTNDGGSEAQWLTAAQWIRDGKPTRGQAYNRFSALRTEGRLKGMGPAYFTKLIYFLTRRDGTVPKPAYIMDRWAGSSINLLTGSNTVLLDGTRTWKRPKDGLDVSYGFTVSDANTGNHYEAFCTAVDRLAADGCLCVDQVDCALFSQGKDGPGTWRRYVQAQSERLLCGLDRSPGRAEGKCDGGEQRTLRSTARSDLRA